MSFIQKAFNREVPLYHHASQKAKWYASSWYRIQWFYPLIPFVVCIFITGTSIDILSCIVHISFHFLIYISYVYCSIYKWFIGSITIVVHEIESWKDYTINMLHHRFWLLSMSREEHQNGLLTLNIFWSITARDI